MVLVARLIFFCLLSFTTGSYATISSQVFNCSGGLGSPVTGGSAVLACQKYIDNYYGSGRYTVTSCSGTTSGSCLYSNGSVLWSVGSASCPSNSTIAGSVCNCNAGYGELNGSCVVNNCASKGTVEGDANNAVGSVGSYPPSSVCLGGCEWTGGGTVQSGCMNGKCYTTGPFTSTGKVCDPNATAASPAPAASTPVTDYACVSKGLCPGTVNGATVCVACSTKSQQTTSTSAQAASSAASGAATTTSSSGTTTTKQTSCSGGSCTTTTTTSTSGSDGSTSQTSKTDTQPESDYCTANPKAAVCKSDDSQWGGSCSAGYTCQGDAVQCAQAQAAYQAACALTVDPSNSNVATGQTAIAAGDLPPDHPRNSAQQVTIDLASRISAVPLFGTTGDCPADKTFTLLGRSFTFPLSRQCTYLRLLGSAFLASCYLMAAFIVFGS